MLALGVEEGIYVQQTGSEILCSNITKKQHYTVTATVLQLLIESH